MGDNWGNTQDAKDTDLHYIRIHLLPLSLIGLTFDDTHEVILRFNPQQKTLSPILQTYFITLMCNLLSYPAGHPNNIGLPTIFCHSSLTTSSMSGTGVLKRRILKLKKSSKSGLKKQ